MDHALPTRLAPSVLLQVYRCVLACGQGGLVGSGTTKRWRRRAPLASSPPYTTYEAGTYAREQAWSPCCGTEPPVRPKKRCSVAEADFSSDAGGADSDYAGCWAEVARQICTVVEVPERLCGTPRAVPAT